MPELSDYRVGQRVETGALSNLSERERRELCMQKGNVVAVTSLYVRVRLDEKPEHFNQEILFHPSEIHVLTICPRCSTKREMYLSDYVTHNLVHDDLDAGLPSRYADPFDYDYDYYARY